MVVSAMRRELQDSPTNVAAPPSSTSGPRQLRADARRNRERILAAADEVLAAEGLSVPIDVIAARAGVGVGTVYRHFPTQEALYEAIVIERFERFVVEAHALTASDDPGAAFFGYLSSMAEQGTQNMALADALARSGYDIKAAKIDVKQRLFAALDGLLTRAQAAGDVRGGITTDDVVALLAASCYTTDRDGGAAAAKRRFEIVCDGLRPPGPR